MEDVLKKAEVNCAEVLDKTSESILVIDRNGKIVFVNDKAEAEIGSGDGEIRGDYLEDHVELEGDEAEVGEALFSPEESNDEGVETGNLEGAWRKNGARIPVRYNTSQLKDSSGNPVGAVVSLKNTTKRDELKRKLRYYRDHDQLTGLYNHLKFREKLDDELSRPDPMGAVLLLDIDRFAEINNSFGHETADNLLVNLAEHLKNKLSEEDTLARFGGDEFVVLASGKNEEEAKGLVTEIIQSVRNYGLRTQGTDLQATISGGFATYPDQAGAAKDLLAKADIALSEAKKSGRNQFKRYDPDRDSQAEVRSRVGWVRQIDNAIKQNNFVLYAQPILELGSDRISHYEVLIRMTEGDKKLISPGQFLPIAEKFGLSRDIDRWVVKETLESISRQNGELDQQLAVNLSGQSLTDNELLAWLKDNPSIESGHFGKMLFEVTETAALSNINSANNFISTLKSRGSQFALDDFGMGFSSFNYLKQLSVDYLKIDGSFIQNLPRDSMNQNLVQSIVEVAHKLHKETIAEFVEDKETLRMVRNYGSDHAQGYFIGRPQPLGSLLR